MWTQPASPTPKPQVSKLGRKGELIAMGSIHLPTPLPEQPGSYSQKHAAWDCSSFSLHCCGWGGGQKREPPHSEGLHTACWFVGWGEAGLGPHSMGFPSPSPPQLQFQHGRQLVRGLGWGEELLC